MGIFPLGLSSRMLIFIFILHLSIFAFFFFRCVYGLINFNILSITSVGPNRVPTFPPRPEPTECETKTASLCSETTSYVVSTVNGARKTVSSQVLKPSCGEVHGCLVADSTKGSTVTKTDECPTVTVTDAVVTCSGTATTDCSTTTEPPRSGCSITASTTTATCTPASSKNGNVRRGEDDNTCPLSEEYIVWPRDGIKSKEEKAIKAAMQNLLKDESKIHVSESKTLGVNFWRVSIEPDQVKKFMEIPNVSRSTGGKRKDNLSRLLKIHMETGCRRP